MVGLDNLGGLFPPAGCHDSGRQRSCAIHPRLQPFHLGSSAAQRSHSCSRSPWGLMVSELELGFSHSRCFSSSVCDLSVSCAVPLLLAERMGWLWDRLLVRMVHHFPLHSLHSCELGDFGASTDCDTCCHLELSRTAPFIALAAFSRSPFRSRPA